MYSARPLGINIKDNDYDVADGFLRESINMQYRDGALRPIPERIISSIDVTGYSDIIFHKVSDEGQINVLAFKSAAPDANLLHWIGIITSGVYASQAPVSIAVTKTTGMSFVILNSLVYFMGDGSSVGEQYYIRLQFSDTDNTYEVKDMYAWKSLIPFYPFQNDISLTCQKNTVNVFSQCGIILIRATLSLKSGEEVLHSPFYVFTIFGLNRSATAIPKGTAIENIHTFVNLDFSFADEPLFEQEISAINIYATIPYYESLLTEEYSGLLEAPILVSGESVLGHITQKSEEPFYLIKTIQSPSNDKILLTVGPIDSDITYTETVSKLDISTIAAGEVMPVDNFTYHKVYGKITSFNGRLVVDNPITVLGEGHIRSLAIENESSNVGFAMDTEDGKVNGVYAIDKALLFDATEIETRGILSYPDARATSVGGSSSVDGSIDTSTINAAGTRYSVNDILSISGGDDNATIKVTAAIGEIVAIEINNAGTGYAQNERITISGGGVDAILTVVTVDGLGKVVDYLLSEVGTGYALASDVATTSDGSGVDFTADIIAVKGAITAYTFENNGTGYSIANAVETMVSPAGGIGFKLNITAVGESVIRTVVKLKKNSAHNIACCFDVYGAGFDSFGITVPVSDLVAISDYNCYFVYKNYTETTSPSLLTAKYSSNNRLQFSESGEFSVWPAKNSYRIGKGRIVAVGASSVNPGENLNLAPLIVGTTDGVYTGNLDPSGNLLFTSFTQTWLR